MDEPRHRKPVFGVSDKVPQSPDSQYSQRIWLDLTLVNLDLGIRVIAKTKLQIVPLFSHMQKAGFLMMCYTVKLLNFRIPENFAVINLKLKQRDQTLGYSAKKMQME